MQKKNKKINLVNRSKCSTSCDNLIAYILPFLLVHFYNDRVN